MSAPNDGAIRAFIAVELSPEAVAEVARLISAVDRMRVRGARAVRPEGVHVTLRFLGDVNPDALSEVEEAMRVAARTSAPFRLSLGPAAAFPDFRRARALYVALEGDVDGLRCLRSGLEDALSLRGFGRDRRRFAPHATVARIRERVVAEDRRRLVEAFTSVGHARLGFDVESFTLFRSELDPDGAVYTPLYRAPLGE